MNDFLNLIVEGDLLKTFANMFEVVIAMDLIASICMIFGNMGGGLSE